MEGNGLEVWAKNSVPMDQFGILEPFVSFGVSILS